MRLSQIIAGMDPRGQGGDPSISRVVSDSRKVVPGSLFVCVAGGSFDGHDFAAEAVKRGAVAIVAEREVETLGAPLHIVPSTRDALMDLALRFHGNPQEALRLVGVTGTNGKTTVSFLVSSILEEAGRKAGLIGTVGTWFEGKRLYAPRLTTPDAISLSSTLAAMRDGGGGDVVMEVSSHGLEQGRVRSLSFQAAAFTNLTRDHLDYHGGMEDYFSAKARLFSEGLAKGGRAVVNVDDPWGEKLLPKLRDPLTVSLKDAGATIHATSFTSSLEGIDLAFSTPLGEARVRSPLIGAFNGENLLVAAGLGCALGLPLRAIEGGLTRSLGAPGRMERVGRGEVAVFVDYAHTDDALRRAIAALREAGPRRLILVFGCGGDRDRGKRPLMGEAAAAADVVVVTSDNPRTEDPRSIVEAIVPGLEKAGKLDYLVELDRREAIALAIREAGPRDAVLIAGKGHENIQIMGEQELPFDDCEEARIALARKRST